MLSKIIVRRLLLRVVPKRWEKATKLIQVLDWINFQVAPFYFYIAKIPGASSSPSFLVSSSLCGLTGYCCY